MTKSAPLLVLLALALTFAPLASAHGAAEARTIDTRILEDDDGFFSYDAGAQAGLAEGGGHDLLTLDVREASDPEGAPVLWFRLTWQTDATEPATDLVRFNAGGQQHEFQLTASTTAIESHSFDAAAGPFDVGDGHPKAFDLMVRYDTLGVQVGDALTGIELVGQASDGSTADVYPGTWMTALGELAPYGGDPTHGAEAGSHTLAGPADLLRAQAPGQAHLDQGESQNLTLTLTNPTDLDQFVFVSVEAVGVTVSAPAGVTVLAGELRDVDLVFEGIDAGTHNVTITLWSDLGGYQLAPVSAMVHGIEGHDHHADHDDHGDHGSDEPDVTDDEHDHSDHDHGDHDATDDAADLAEESPGVGFAALALGLVAIALIRRK